MTLFWFPGDRHLRTETCTNSLCCNVNTETTFCIMLVDCFELFVHNARIEQHEVHYVCVKLGTAVLSTVCLCEIRDSRANCSRFV